MRSQGFPPCGEAEESTMLPFGFGLIALSLVMGLFEVHVRRLETWDRPRWTLSRAFPVTWPLARRAVVLFGLIVVVRASRPAAAVAVAGLVALWGYLAWMASERYASRRIARELRELQQASPGLTVTDGLRGILGRRHPEWGADLIERIVHDHPDAAGVARVIVRLERGWSR